jgi:hypothetical protein
LILWFKLHVRVSQKSMQNVEITRCVINSHFCESIYYLLLPENAHFSQIHTQSTIWTLKSVILMYPRHADKQCDNENTLYLFVYSSIQVFFINKHS